MNPKVKITNEYLKQLRPLTFMEDDGIKERFIGTYKATHAGCSEEEAEDFFNIESVFFKRIVSASADLQACTMFSLYACFMDIIISNLTFDPEAGLLYVLFDNFNAGTRDNAVWEKRAKNEISPYGELAMRIQQGQILYADDPVIVYDCDEWQPGYREDGIRYSLYKAKLPRPSNAVIIGSFIKLTRPDKSFDIPWFTQENINEWKRASTTKNKGKTNALYGGDDGQITIGFFKAKTIKHSFKALPKLKMALANTSLEGGGLEISASGQLQESKPAATADVPPAFKANVSQPATATGAAAPPPFNIAQTPVAPQPGTFTVNTEEFSDAPF